MSRVFLVHQAKIIIMFLCSINCCQLCPQYTQVHVKVSLVLAPSGTSGDVARFELLLSAPSNPIGSQLSCLVSQSQLNWRPFGAAWSASPSPMRMCSAVQPSLLLTKTFPGQPPHCLAGSIRLEKTSAKLGGPALRKRTSWKLFA